MRPGRDKHELQQWHGVLHNPMLLGHVFCVQRSLLLQQRAAIAIQQPVLQRLPLRQYLPAADAVLAAWRIDNRPVLHRDCAARIICIRFLLFRQLDLRSKPGRAACLLHWVRSGLRKLQ